ncbi:hypothetical protein HanIR_Chr03g0122851 [Helianthus annuus]|nr:hypothetical protein HanIR_Chr03g0122851 [Helianthus annuus]
MCVSIGPFLPSISISLHFATVKEPFDLSPQAQESLEPPILQANNILSKSWNSDNSSTDRGSLYQFPLKTNPSLPWATLSLTLHFLFFSNL